MDRILKDTVDSQKLVRIIVVIYLLFFRILVRNIRVIISLGSESDVTQYVIWETFLRYTAMEIDYNLAK